MSLTEICSKSSIANELVKTATQFAERWLTRPEVINNRHVFRGAQHGAVVVLIAVSVMSLPPSLQADDSTSGEKFFDETKAITLFSFDDHAIPLTQNLKLKMLAPRRHPDNPVVQRGQSGDPDSWAVQFYGSVLRENGKFRMWYVAVGDDRLKKDVPRSSPWRVAYAESNDGIHWTKPHLGLVEYNGNRDNNLVSMTPRLGTVNIKVIHDPTDPDPQRRYKMGAHVWFPKNDVRLGTFAPYGSPDGLNWTLLTDGEPVDAELPEKDLVLPALHFEPVGGMYYWDGLFHLSGQNAIIASRPYHGRVTRSFVSADFVNWSQASSVGFVRTPQHNLLGPGRSRDGEQTHEGISVWNRNNVLVGISGMWHGAPEWSGVTIDLGFAISNDGVHFREPAHEHIFMKRGSDGEWDQGGLLQGQGFENLGTQTFVYYGAWDPRHWQDSPPRGGVGIAVFARDRLSELVADETTKGDGNYQMPETTCEFITRSLDLSSLDTPKFYVNADGLGQQAALKIELLDHRLQPLPDFSGHHAAILTTSGFQTPVTWSGHDIPDTVRLRVTFTGARRTDIHFHNIYIR